MPPLEPAITQAHAETRKALDILRAKGLEFPLLVPTSAEGLEFTGVAPHPEDPHNISVEMIFGSIDVGKPDGRNAAIALMQVKSDRTVTFAPVPNLQTKKVVTLRGSTATFEIGGPYEYVSRGSAALTWQQNGIHYRVTSSGVSEEQLLRFANSLVPLP